MQKRFRWSVCPLWKWLIFAILLYKWIYKSTPFIHIIWIICLSNAHVTNSEMNPILKIFFFFRCLRRPYTSRLSRRLKQSRVSTRGTGTWTSKTEVSKIGIGFWNWMGKRKEYQTQFWPKTYSVLLCHIDIDLKKWI